MVTEACAEMAGKDARDSRESPVPTAYVLAGRATNPVPDDAEEYRTVAEFANDAIVVVQDGRAVYRNRACRDLIGFSPLEEADGDFLDAVVPGDRERVGRYHARLLRGETVPAQYEMDILTREGNLVPLEVKPRAIPYRGRPAVLAVMRDIRRRRRMEQALRDSETRYRVLAENVTDGVAVIQEGSLVFLNDAFCTLVGRAREELLEAG
ncbi:MAG: PAS domain S-box protein, partial [Deltaproteobacteria bacterium]|nr:PAS domain S-box protein [Deltaproteobacteria bacterium]